MQVNREPFREERLDRLGVVGPMQKSEFEPVIAEPTLLDRLGAGRREGLGLR